MRFGCGNGEEGGVANVLVAAELVSAGDSVVTLGKLQLGRRIRAEKPTLVLIKQLQID